VQTKTRDTAELLNAITAAFKAAIGGFAQAESNQAQADQFAESTPANHNGARTDTDPLAEILKNFGKPAGR
jgi:hypothetical protein